MKVHSLRQALFLISSNEHPVQKALYLLENHQKSLNLLDFSKFKTIANLLIKIQDKKVFTIAFLDYLSKTDQFKKQKLKDDILSWIEEEFKFYPGIKKELFDFYSQKKNSPLEKQNKPLYSPAKNFIKTNEIGSYSETLKNKPAINTEETIENDPVLADFYNKKQGLLVSIQLGMSPDFTLLTAKNYHENKEEIKKNKQEIPTNVIEEKLLQITATPFKNKTGKKAVLHGSLIVDDRKLTYYARTGVKKGIIYNDDLMYRVFHSYENAATNQYGIINNTQVDLVESLNNEAYFEIIKEDPELEKNYNEIVFVPHYQSSLSPQTNASLNILGYFLVLPIARMKGDFKKMFSDPDFYKNNKIYNKEELEVLLEEIANSTFSLYAHDNEQGKLHKLNKDVILHAIYEAKKEKLIQERRSTAQWDLLYTKCLEKLHSSSVIYPELLPVKTVDIPLYKTPEGEFVKEESIERESNKIFNFFKKIFFKKIFLKKMDNQIVPQQQTQLYLSKSLKDAAELILSKMKFPTTEVNLLATEINQKTKSRAIYEKYKQNSIIKDIFKEITNTEIEEIVKSVFPINTNFGSASAEDRNRLISKLQRLKEHFEEKKDLKEEEIVFFKNSKVEGLVLNNIPFKTCTNIKNEDVYKKKYNFPEEPSTKETKLRVGVVVLEEDGRCWVHYPKDLNHHKQGYYGKVLEFTRGGKEKDQSLHQVAIKEAWEEMGLVIEPTSYLGDIFDGKDHVRYYLAKRISGNPSAWDKVHNETSAVKLIDPKLLEKRFFQFNNVEKKQGVSDAIVLEMLKNKQDKNQPILKAKK